ncbi:Coenzyme F420 hydrogenase/dehydrogenase, beta subunit C-terminal domain [Holdemania massiliensis]|uniref:Coenzyme F420 hydrogenase/dehydrogenase, beta subunit C-terminal domain n=1 Tax=Holdemania massiliensis TaxID=1468449 RepID=UPI001C9D2E77|nr:Coenzyme F420 hydrogenase/dehydrogenase, beta subunit C-terminal domain [Holdemania massiliensis]
MIVDKDKCTGCRACETNCPVNAISFLADREGFLAPQIDKNICIECGKCYVKCPSNTDYCKNLAEVGYVVQYGKTKLTKQSASGGAFVGLAIYFLEKCKALVVGASLCDDLVVRHIVISSSKEITKLQNSKYVQSNIGNIYKIVAEALKNNKIVLFTGTPCQIAGLYASLPQKEYSNLYTADIVCHGVPSPFFLKRSLDENSKTKQGKVVSYKFRHKNPITKSTSSYIMMMKMMRGLPIVREPKNDPYFNLFMQGMSFRESCYQCRYACLTRPGDFTMGDCDSKMFYPDFHPKESNSILLINSEKARKIWNAVKKEFDYVSLDVQREANYNHQLKHPYVRPTERDELYNVIFTNDWKIVNNKFSKIPSKIARYKLLLLAFIPNGIINIYSKIRNYFN